MANTLDINGEDLGEELTGIGAFTARMRVHRFKTWGWLGHPIRGAGDTACGKVDLVADLASAKAWPDNLCRVCFPGGRIKTPQEVS